MVRADVEFTVDDYRSLPETGPRHQLIEGELVRTTPAPSRRHQDLVWELGGRLRGFVRGGALGYVGGSPLDVYLSQHDVLQPDLLFVSSARLERVAHDGVHGAPDLVIEVLSPGTRHLDLGAKKRLYARHGVREYWVVDPQDETLTCYDLERAPDEPRTHAGAARFTSALLPGFELVVEELFRAA
ncbi:MAG: Uma2 family endonuclease [Planctomycetes bacterium]|nr:Uma2 family endonuclease [Planctomycetota bacterium]